MLFRVVAANGHNAGVLIRIIFAKCRKFMLDVLDERAVAADEHYQQRFLPGEAAERNRVT